MEHRIILLGGKVLWLMNRGKAWFAGSDGGKRLDRFCGALLGITDRKRTEETLRASDERFHSLAKATNDTVYDWNVVTGSVWWNEGMRTLALAFGNDTESWQGEYRFRCADGSYKMVFDRGFMTRDAEGRTVRMIGVMMDVTARRKAEEELHRFRLLVEESNDFIAMAGFDGRCLFLNAGGPKMGGLGEPKAKGSVLDYAFEEDREAAAKIWAKAATEGKWQGEFRLRHRVTGKTVPVLWNIFVLQRPESPRLFAMAAVGRDLSLLKEKEEQIRQGQKLEAIAHLAGGIAHDFNNILTVINGYGELLLHRFNPEDPDRKLLTTMLDSGRRAATLTRQLLAYGRKQLLQPRILDLNDIVGDIAGMLRRQGGGDIEVEVRMERPLDRVRADPVQINHILLNLGLNARDAMSGLVPGPAPKGGPGGVIRVETANTTLKSALRGRYGDLPAGLYVTLTVTDTGRGMVPEVLDHLFEPFFTTKPVGKGTGLELSSAYGIIQQSGGGIEVSSEPGKGSTFRVYLPSVSQDQPPTPPEAAPPAGATPKGCILLAVAEDPVRRIIRNLLENGGYAVSEAGDGVEALCLLGGSDPTPDLILADTDMPRMGGHQLAEEARRRHPSMGILFMSGNPDEAYPEAYPKRDGHEEGFHILRKPFTSQSLLRAVEGALLSHPMPGGVSP